MLFRSGTYPGQSAKAQRIYGAACGLLGGYAVIILLQVCAVALQVAYQFVFYWILHTFLPLRKGRGRRIAAFFVSLTFTDIIIYQNDLTNILVAFCALSIYLAVFHQGRLAEKASAVFIFYPIMVSMNFFQDAAIPHGTLGY